MKKVNVLVTGIGGPIAQGILMGLKELDYVHIIGADRRSLTSGHHFCDKTYTIPRYTDLSAYKKSILAIVEKENIDAVFPSLAPEIHIYNKIRDDIPATIALPVSNHFDILKNKVKSYEFLEAHGLQEYVPDYYKFTKNQELKNIIEQHFRDESYIIVKPSETYGAIGAVALTDRKNYLKAISENKNKIVSIDDYYDIDSFEGEDRFAISYMDGMEYSVDLFLHDNEVVVAIPRERSGVSNGIVLEGTVVNNPELITAASRISESMASDGFINLQFFETKNGYKLTDINPRFAGSQVMSLGAGVNFPEIFLKLSVLNEPVEVTPEWGTKMFRYRVPKFYNEAEIPKEQSLYNSKTL